MAGLENAEEYFEQPDPFFTETPKKWAHSVEGVGHWWPGNPQKGVAGSWVRLVPAGHGWREFRRGLRGLSGSNERSAPTQWALQWIDSMGE